MKTDTIREKFLEFFQSKGHKIVASDTLVPKNDPTVLFTTAGMQQFKRQFLGHIDDYTRAASSQKCLRTDDLEEVGRTDFHHTFFEMLGNFSFGDYFKKEAIRWAWEFLTKELNIPQERLWVSVYKDDKEAENIWLNDIKIPKEKVFKLGDKSNFWPSNAKQNGPNGPCGPCSEIFYDYAPQDKTIPNDPDDIPGRFSEVWNLVFTQFERKDGGELVPLPNKNIDTGMGLERLAAVMQGKQSNFETDIFAEILQTIDSITNILTVPGTRNERYVIADHIRAVVIGIADGVIPSNEGRGYVIKRLIIDATDIFQRHGQTKACFYQLAKTAADIFLKPYPELKKKIQNISDTIKGVEEAYIKVLKERIPELKKQSQNARSAEELGQLMFKSKDTYGLTITTIEKTLEELNIDKTLFQEAKKTFQELLQKQQEQSRAKSKMTGDVFTGNELDINVPKTDFAGHKCAETTSTVLRLFVDNNVTPEAKEGESVKIVLDRTPFYAESGGQIGDTGKITCDDVQVLIEDTQKISDVFLHHGKVIKGTLRINAQVKAVIDLERRLSIMRNHTATHILQAALRNVLGDHVQQQGSYVNEERLRFDFTHPKALTDRQIQEIEFFVNKAVLNCDTVTKSYLSMDEAKNSGALAFFAEKYGEVVRVVSVGDVSKEFCGGTHLDNTGQIGFLKIVSESAIAQGIRRVEAKTGLNALTYVLEMENNLTTLSRELKVPAEEIPSRIKMQMKKIKDMEKELESFRLETLKTRLEEILAAKQEINGVPVIAETFKNIDMNLLRKLNDLIKQKLTRAVTILGAKDNENAYLLIGVSDSLTEKGLSASALIKNAAALMDGSGGGRDNLAQAGSKAPKKLEEAVQKALSLVKENLAP